MKVTDLTELIVASPNDVIPIVDVSEDITKKVQTANLPISTSTQTALDSKQATLVSGTNIKTINSTSLLGSGDISILTNPSGGAGSIQFSDGSAFASDSNLFWDNTNKRLGVGTNAPTSALHVVGNTFVNSGSSLSNGLSIGDSLTASKLYYFSGGLYFKILGADILNMNNSGVSIGSSAQANNRLQIKGSGSTSATTSLLVQNSSGTAALTVKDDLSVTVGGNISASIGILGGGIWTSVYRSSTGQIWGETSGTGVNSKMTLSSLIAMTGLPTTRPSNVGDIYIDTAANILSNGDKVIGVRQ